MKTVTSVISRLLDEIVTPNFARTSVTPKLENINHQPTRQLKIFGFMTLFCFQTTFTLYFQLYAVQNGILRVVIDHSDSKSCFYEVFKQSEQFTSDSKHI